MATSWKSQQGNGEFALQFETDNREKYKLVEMVAQMAVDGKTIADVVEIKHGYIIERQGTEDDYCCECSVCSTHEVSLGDKYCSECGAKLDVGYAEPHAPKERGGEK